MFKLMPQLKTSTFLLFVDLNNNNNNDYININNYDYINNNNKDYIINNKYKDNTYQPLLLILTSQMKTSTF